MSELLSLSDVHVRFNTAAGVVRVGTMRVPAPWRLSAMPSSRSTW